MKKAPGNAGSVQSKWYILVSVIFFAVVYLFQRPYYFVLYDSEPDYLGNALHIVNWGFPNAAHHPATVTYYFLALIIKLVSGLSLKLASVIIVLRISLLAVCYLLIYSGCKIYGNREKFTRFAYAVTLTFLLPSINYFADLLSAETLLFGLGFLVAARLYKYVNNGLKGNYVLPVLLGICLSVKLSAISLVAIAGLVQLYHLYFLYSLSQSRAELFKQVKSFFFFYFLLFGTFLLLSVPVIFIVSDSFFNLFGRLKDDFSYRSILLFIAVILVSGFVLFKFRLLGRKSYDTAFFFILLCRFVISLCAIMWCVYFVKTILTTDSHVYSSFAIATRHFNPLLALIFVPGFFWQFKWKVFFIGKRAVLVITILVALVIKISINLSYKQYAETYQQRFSAITDSLYKQADHIMVYPSSEFVSKEMFELWTTYRYGNGMIHFANTFSDEPAKEPLKRLSYITFRDISKKRWAGAFSEKGVGIQSADNAGSKKEKFKAFLRKQRSAAYTKGKFVSRLIGFPPVASVYDHALYTSPVSIPDTTLKIGLIVPAINIDYLNDGHPKGNYFVVRTPAKEKNGYIDSLRSKLQERKIMTGESTIGNTDLHLLYFQLNPVKQ